MCGRHQLCWQLLIVCRGRVHFFQAAIVEVQMEGWLDLLRPIIDYYALLICGRSLQSNGDVFIVMILHFVEIDHTLNLVVTVRPYLKVRHLGLIGEWVHLTWIPEKVPLNFHDRHVKWDGCRVAQQFVEL